MSSKSDPKERKTVSKNVLNYIKVQKGSTKGVKYNIFPCHSGLSEAVTTRAGGLREAVSEPRPGGLRKALTINN